MYFVYPKPKNLDDLERGIRAKKVELNNLKLRGMVDIVVIDDAQFQPFANLTNNGFKLRHLPDIHDILQVKDFPIILCDLQGVGSTLNPQNQGAHLIKEIKQNNPEKYVLCYTGGAQNSNLTRLASEYADSYLKKDADVSDWLERLDAAIKTVTDPVLVWHAFRLRLLDVYQVPLVDILRLEDAYVRGCLAGKHASPELIMRQAIKSQESSRGVGVIEEFVSSPLFKTAVQLAQIYMGHANA